MSISRTKQRLIENEMLFRRLNEQVASDLGHLNDMHREDGHGELVRNDDLILNFWCECADENCKTRISLHLTEYEAIHAARDQFIIVPGHEVAPIETTVKETAAYHVVKKKMITPEPSGSFRHTSVENG